MDFYIEISSFAKWIDIEANFLGMHAQTNEEGMIQSSVLKPHSPTPDSFTQGGPRSPIISMGSHALQNSKSINKSY